MSTSLQAPSFNPPHGTNASTSLNGVSSVHRARLFGLDEPDRTTALVALSIVLFAVVAMTTALAIMVLTTQ